MKHLLWLFLLFPSLSVADAVWDRGASPYKVLTYTTSTCYVFSGHDSVTLIKEYAIMCSDSSKPSSDLFAYVLLPPGKAVYRTFTYDNILIKIVEVGWTARDEKGVWSGGLPK